MTVTADPIAPEQGHATERTDWRKKAREGAAALEKARDYLQKKARSEWPASKGNPGDRGSWMVAQNLTRLLKETDDFHLRGLRKFAPDLEAAADMTAEELTLKLTPKALAGAYEWALGRLRQRALIMCREERQMCAWGVEEFCDALGMDYPVEIHSLRFDLNLPVVYKQAVVIKEGGVYGHNPSADATSARQQLTEFVRGLREQLAELLLGSGLEFMPDEVKAVYVCSAGVKRGED